MDRDGKVTDPLRHHILEAVDCLRQRKCRPDRESIAHYVLRKFGSTMNEIFAELENIVDEGGLIKVEYKGTTSYRSPSNFDTKNSPLLTKHSKILNSSKTTMLIITGINELLAKDPNFAKEGVPLDELKESLVGYDNVRFGEDKLDILLERETNCGSISIAKSSILKDSLRVFPKDIPVPQDMRIISLTTDNSTTEKEEKKPRKPRKSANATTAAAGSSGVGIKKVGRGKIKKEPADTPEPESIDEVNNKEENNLHVDKEPQPVIATKSKPVITGSLEQTEEAQKEQSPKKTARLSPVKRKLVHEQVAETVRKTYEETPEFETTSAQMIKLAESVVSKQVEETAKSKGPILVLAGTITTKSGNIDTESGPNVETEASLPLNCEPMEIETNEITFNQSPKTKQATTPLSGKKRGRPPANKEKVVDSTKTDKDEESKHEEESETAETATTESSPTTEGLTRSKRDKRKRQVFDPSDLPNTYTTYSSSKASIARKSRSNRSPSPEEPPPKKTAKQEKTPPKKTIPVTSGSKVDASKETKKSGSNEKQSNKKSSLPLKKTSNDCTSEPEQELKTPPDALNAENEKDASEKEETKNGDLNNLNKNLATASNSDKKPTSTKEKGSCEYCEKNAGVDEELLTCASCQASIHPSCMDCPPELAQRIREFNLGNGGRLIKWQCLYCKTCGVCKQKMMQGSDSTTPGVEEPFSSGKKDVSKNEVQCVLCENCDVGFHAKCVESFPEKVEGGIAYLCQECKESKTPDSKVPEVTVNDAHGEKSNVKKSTTSGKKVRRPVRRQSKVVIKQEVEQPEQDSDSAFSPADFVDVKFEIAENVKVEMVVAEGSRKKDTGSSDSNDTDEEDADSSKMDITGWTTSDVEAYFTEKGLKEEAAILKDQEVDGYSLLLLQREDIVKGMGFRLGPALKVNRIIYELQSKAPVRAKWNGQLTSESENGDSTKPPI